MTLNAGDVHEGISANKMRAVVTNLIDAISAMDGTALRPLLADDAVMELPFAPPTFPAPPSGGEMIAVGLSGATKLFAKFRMKALAFYPSPETDSIIVETESEGAPVNGGKYANRYVFLFKFRGEKIVLWREYFNPTRLADLGF